MLFPFFSSFFGSLSFVVSVFSRQITFFFFIYGKLFCLSFFNGTAGKHHLSSSSAGSVWTPCDVETGASPALGLWCLLMLLWISGLLLVSVGRASVWPRLTSNSILSALSFSHSGAESQTEQQHKLWVLLLKRAPSLSSVNLLRRYNPSHSNKSSQKHRLMCLFIDNLAQSWIQYHSLNGQIFVFNH